MKKILQIILISLIATSCFGQIDNNLMNGNWKTEKEKVIYGNNVMRVEGKNDIRGMTNVGYETFAQLKAGIEKDAEKQMWTEEKKNETIKLYNKFSSGGLIHLYITRLTIDAANTKMFTIIVKDSAETEIFRKELESDVPNVPSSGTRYWWNYESIALPISIQGNVSIYVIDRLGKDNSKFRFDIKL